MPLKWRSAAARDPRMAAAAPKISACRILQDTITIPITITIAILTTSIIIASSNNSSSSSSSSSST